MKKLLPRDPMEIPIARKLSNPMVLNRGAKMLLSLRRGPINEASRGDLKISCHFDYRNFRLKP
jgi:hypothetical protein